MLADPFCDRISSDWLWRERDLRDLDAQILKSKQAPIVVKSGIVIAYSHWEGHFKSCATELLGFIVEGIKRKSFLWTDVKQDVRQRILFCLYRRSNLLSQTHETFISYLNALHDGRYAEALGAKDEIIMIDDNLNALRAEAICRNLGVDYQWCALKKVIIDERILEYRNAIAHGSPRLRSGDQMDFADPDVVASIDEARALMREAKNQFLNCIQTRVFLV